MNWNENARKHLKPIEPKKPTYRLSLEELLELEKERVTEPE